MGVAVKETGPGSTRSRAPFSIPNLLGPLPVLWLTQSHLTLLEWTVLEGYRK
jgi:hypothetical protein